MPFKMMTFPCSFQNGGKQPVNFYIGHPAADSHPIGFQMKWLGAKGGQVPENVNSALTRLKAIAVKHNIPFVDLCEYVIANMQKK